MIQICTKCKYKESGRNYPNQICPKCNGQMYDTIIRNKDKKVKQ